MAQETVDPETLAAFLDGTLSPSERARVLEALAHSDLAYDSLVEASALTAAVSSPEERRDPGAAFLGRRRARVFLGSSALAAGIVALFLWRSGGSGAAPTLDPLRYPASARVSALSTGWHRASVGAVRGGVSASGGRARAFRLGAQTVDLELAAAQSPEAAREVAQSIRELAADVEGAEPAMARLVSIEATPPGTSADRARVATVLRSATNESAPWFDLGTWVENARVAASARDSSFFTGPGVEVLGRALDRIAVPQRSIDPDGAHVVERLGALRIDRAARLDFMSVAALLDSIAIVGGR